MSRGGAQNPQSPPIAVAPPLADVASSSDPARGARRRSAVGAGRLVPVRRRRRSDGPRSDGPRSDGPRSDGPCSTGPRHRAGSPQAGPGRAPWLRLDLGAGAAAGRDLGVATAGHATRRMGHALRGRRADASDGSWVRVDGGREFDGKRGSAPPVLTEFHSPPRVGPAARSTSAAAWARAGARSLPPRAARPRAAIWGRGPGGARGPTRYLRIEPLARHGFRDAWRSRPPRGVRAARAGADGVSG